MTRSIFIGSVCTFLLLALSGPVAAQGRPPDPAALLAAQRESMLPLQSMNGVWRGTASMVHPGGEKQVITQTERIGPFLDGAVKVIEGRGYDAAGKLAFNSFGIVSFNPATRSYSMRSYARGLVGDFVFRPIPDGYAWEIPAGPATIRYTVTIKGSTLHEIGERIVAGSEPVRFFEMTLQRVGDTDWPAGGAVGAR